MGTSDMILQTSRTLAAQGELGRLAEMVGGWLREHGSNGPFVRSRLPAILLNEYVLEHLKLPARDVTRYTLAHPDWTKTLDPVLTDPARLPWAVAQLVDNIRSSS